MLTPLAAVARLLVAAERRAEVGRSPVHEDLAGADPRRDAARAIESRKRTYTFPWQMNVLKEVMARAPEPVIRMIAPAPRTRSSK